jgi:glutaredoxin 3|tara:strand:- start:887 stop:1207 length:321 start_codon:yes stop_codon:yes gene_type:complete
MLMQKAIFKMYIMDDCPYCVKAQDIIVNEERASLHVINITKDPHTRELIKEETGQKTLPAIFIGNEFVGGCDDLCALRNSGELEIKILKQENTILKDEVLRLRRSL